MDDPVGIDHADVPGVFDVIERVARPDGHLRGIFNFRVGSGTAVAGVTVNSRAGEGRNDTGGIDLSDALVVFVGYIDVAGGIDRDGNGLGKRRGCGGSTVAAIAGDAVSGE